MGGWGSGVAAACLTVLSLWRWQDGETGWATVLLALAFLQLAITARRTSVRVGAGTAASGAPTTADAEHARRHQPGWRVIGLGGIVAALATAAFVPPLALVLAGLGVYATTRARGYGRVLASA